MGNAEARIRELEALLAERDAELAQACAEQTATAEILCAISRSPTNTQPVFDAVAENAARLCGAYDVVIRLLVGNEHCAVAHHGQIPVMPPHATGFEPEAVIETWSALSEDAALN